MNIPINRCAIRPRYGGKPSGGDAIRDTRRAVDEEALSKASRAPRRRMAVLAIANRLDANQAPGDMVERRARVWRVRQTAEWYS
jgi:hypothetical protein